MRAGPDLQVLPMLDRPQESLGGVPAHAFALVHIEVADSFVASPVEVVGGRQPGLLSRPCDRVEDRPVQALPLDSPLTTLALPAGVETGGGMKGIGTTVGILVLQEVREAVVPAPSRIRTESVARAPAVVVTGLAAHIDHPVDAAAAAKHLATRIAQRAAVQAGLGVGFIHPVGARVTDAAQVPNRNVDPRIVIVAPGLDQKHPLRRVGTQPIRQQATSSARTADDVVVKGLAVSPIHHGCDA